MALDEIVAHTRMRVAERKASGPAYAELARSDRSLEAALRRPRTGFVLECKQASPSRGRLREPYDPVRIARCYAAHADAISVLTNARYFEGSLAHLQAVREAVDLPVLCKDFIVDPWQVREARAHGADAVLLMLSVLDDAAYRAAAAEAAALRIDVLTEVHTDDELRRALVLGARIIGINNRDLRTLQIDREVTRRLAPQVPVDRIVIAESGIRDHRDVEHLQPMVDGFLVGTSLMEAPDLEQATRRLIYGVTKVCGLTRPEDAERATACGASHGGLIFAEESPRRVAPARAAAIQAGGALDWVGVFVNAPAAAVAETAIVHRLAAVQLHGEESMAYVRDLRAKLPAEIEIWKAVRVKDAVIPLAATGTDRLVLDTWSHGSRGGTGQTFDWALAGTAADRSRSLLGGGLTPDSARAAARVGTWGLDVNSGVEHAPGIKDADRLARFFAARRGDGRTGRETA